MDIQITVPPAPSELTALVKPSYYASFGIPYGKLGKVELERDAYYYALALARSGDVWRVLPFEEAKEFMPELEEWSPKAPAALDWDDHPLTPEKAAVIGKGYDANVKLGT